MTRIEHRTSRCALHGHPEITIVVDNDVLLPDAATTLVSWLEAGVARGTRFQAGQTLRLGWSMLRIVERADGTLGLHELDRNDGTWREGVGTALADAWYQKEVVSSLGLEEPVYPQQGQSVFVCDRAEPGAQRYMMARSASDGPTDSGWFVGCCDRDHDHNDAANLACVDLVELAARLPFIVQFLALPPGIHVFVEWSQNRRIVPTVYIDGLDEECVPVAGSYLEALRSVAQTR